MRNIRKLEGGRHADAVAQAEAILFCEDTRIRARHLAWELDLRNEIPFTEDSLRAYCVFLARWADRVRPLLEQVARG